MHLPAKIAAELARFSDAFAASATLADDELLPRRPRPALRARPEPKPRPARLDRPPPHWSRQFMQPTSTRVIVDPRLTDGAGRLACLIRGMAGKAGVTATTKLYLAKRTGRSVSTIRRRLIELEALGYIEVERPLSARGTNTGLLIRITGLLLPYYKLVIPGVPELPPTKSLFKKKASRGAGYRPRKHRQSAQRAGPCPPRAAACPC
jgi:hypothetical protein